MPPQGLGPACETCANACRPLGRVAIPTGWRAFDSPLPRLFTQLSSISADDGCILELRLQLQLQAQRTLRYFFPRAIFSSIPSANDPPTVLLLVAPVIFLPPSVSLPSDLLRNLKFVCGFNAPKLYISKSQQRMRLSRGRHPSHESDSKISSKDQRPLLTRTDT